MYLPSAYDNYPVSAVATATKEKHAASGDNKSREKEKAPPEDFG